MFFIKEQFFDHNNNYIYQLKIFSLNNEELALYLVDYFNLIFNKYKYIMQIKNHNNFNFNIYYVVHYDDYNNDNNDIDNIELYESDFLISIFKDNYFYLEDIKFNYYFILEIINRDNNFCLIDDEIDIILKYINTLS